jgi:hypothetical protein
MSGLVGWGELLFWFSLDSLSWFEELGGGGLLSSWLMVQKFFNRYPKILKFGTEKNRERERESQERERERERERKRERVVILYLLVVVVLHY